MWINFSISAFLVIFAGYYLTEYGDEISEKSSISGGFIGFFLLALTTSLPELITSISAIYFQGEPQLALGNIFGSNLFNIGIIFLLDFFSKKGAFADAKKENIVSIAYILIISLLAIIPMIFNSLFNINILPSMPINIESILILLFYIYILRTFNNSVEEEQKELDFNKGESLVPVYLKFALMGAIIVVSGIFLTKSVDQIAEAYNLGKTFAGSMFLAFVTSLPEATVSISAIRIGAINMALGNVLGSNVFNVLIIFFADIFTKRQLLYIDELKSSIITGVFSLLIAAVALYGIIKKSKNSSLLFNKVSFPGLFILIVYFLGMYFTYAVK